MYRPIIQNKIIRQKFCVHPRSKFYISTTVQDIYFIFSDYDPYLR
ncbi:hypothetical protein BN938_1006 [Mucinivorans hirudinis]|uniref:Uncharacterized protein n=1 Tax=Mucinivorans hirudinis TaxID=1433126 RepID=A0A060RCG3_9BACT|nr:hypothetical protein BN938_1006 [Mucinivorans hirudinis]